MAAVTYQTIRLSKGHHASPNEGACVMELASMLSGEPFSDHPVCVCPVIGSLLRTYNDLIDDELRADLYPYAAKVVGSIPSRQVRQQRIERVTEWSVERRRFRWTRYFLARRLRAIAAGRHPEMVGAQAAYSLPMGDSRAHQQVLALIDELLTIGSTRPVPASNSGASGCADSTSPETDAQPASGLAGPVG